MGSGQVLMSLLILIVAFELSTKPVTAQTTEPTTTTAAPTTTTTTAAPTTTTAAPTTTTTAAPTTTTTAAPTTTTTAAPTVTTTTAAPTTTTTTAAPTTTTTAAPTTTTTAAPPTTTTAASTTTTTAAPTTATTAAPTTTTTAAPTTATTAAPTTTTTAAPTTTTTAAPTTTTAAGTTAQPYSTTQMSFKTKDTFKSELLNLSSTEAKSRTSNIISQLGPYYKSAFSAFSTMDVIGYSNGSINNSLTLAFSSGSVPNPNEIAKVLVAAAANITVFTIDTNTISVNGTATSSGVSHRISLITASCLVLLSWLLTNRQ